MERRPIRSREHLLHVLAEASELEHNLLCSYLYAAFSLKQTLDEDLLPHELETVRRWHDAVMQVCREEMTHLAQVANLMISVGSRPHFDRPNLPVSPGYHPARIQVALAPFDLDTLDHFIYLERPETSMLEDVEAFRPTEPYKRRPEFGVLMPSAPDYRTIGEFYELLQAGLTQLAQEMGEDKLFIGSADYQMRPDEIGSEDLFVVTDLASAGQAIHLIVVQGEGAPAEAQTSHFERFRSIREEFARLLEARPGFRPSRNVARNPVMRRPVDAGRVHVNAPAAAGVLDAANAVYALMLRCLTAVYDTPRTSTIRRKALLGGAMGLMKVLAGLSDALTQLKAGNGEDDVKAGVTFAMLRSTEGLAPGVDVATILGQRFERIGDQLPRIGLPAETARGMVKELAALRDALLSSSPWMQKAATSRTWEPVP